MGTSWVWTGKFTITDAAITGSSKVLCWQAPGPYTGKGTSTDQAQLEPVRVISTVPAAGSAVVYWETPPMVAHPVLTGNGKPNVTVSTGSMFGPTHPFLAHVRINKVRGNIKFTYMVL